MKIVKGSIVTTLRTMNYTPNKGNQTSIPKGARGVVWQVAPYGRSDEYKVNLDCGHTVVYPADALCLSDTDSKNMFSIFTEGDEVQLRWTVLYGIARFEKGSVGTIESRHYTPASGYCYDIKMNDGRMLETVQNNLKLVETHAKPEAEKFLFIKKASGQQFYGRVKYKSDKFMIVDRFGGVNEEVSIEKSKYTIFKEVK